MFTSYLSVHVIFIVKDRKSLHYQPLILNHFRIVPYIANHVSGADERGRMIRRTLVRYLLISETLVFQAISPTVKARFPTVEHIVEAGELTLLCLR